MVHRQNYIKEIRDTCKYKQRNPHPLLDIHFHIQVDYQCAYTYINI